MSNPEWPDMISGRAAELNSKTAESELQDYLALAQELLKGVGGLPALTRAEKNGNTPELDAFSVAQIAGKRLAAEQERERARAMQQRQLEQLYQQNKFYRPPPIVASDEPVFLSSDNQKGNFLYFPDVDSVWGWIRTSTFALIVLFLSEVSNSALFIACTATRDPFIGHIRLLSSDEARRLLEILRGGSQAFLVQGMDGVSQERLLSFQEIVAPTKCEAVERQISFDD